MGEKQTKPFQLSFNGLLKVDFQGSHVTSDGGLILVRELDERLGLGKLIDEHLTDSRQGACFVFREGFESAVLRMAFGADGSLFVGMTNRGWNSLGARSFGLQCLVWTGRTPFEIKTFEARRDGFELSFTKKVDGATGSAASSYQLSSYTYAYHRRYGSEEIDTKQPAVRSATVSPDGLRVRLKIDGLREGYVHELHAQGVRSAAGEKLLHPRGYYTLNQIPD